jgi:preprotein translocase subunit SecG
VFGLLLTLLILDGIFLIVVVLLQSGKGGGLAAMGGGGGGTDSFMGSRQAAGVLTRSTWISGGVFILLAVVLSVLSSQRRSATPLLQDEFQSAPAAPQPILPGVGEGQGQGDQAPAAGDAGPGVEGGAAPEGDDTGG